MRTLPADLGAERRVQTRAWCYRVTRRDGVVLGFTTHNRDLTFDGVTYEAASGVDASALQQSEGASTDNLSALGLLRSDRITDVDLMAGLYDGARVDLYVVNWGQSPVTQPYLFLRTFIGQIRVGAGHYEAELRSLSDRLSQQIGELTQPTCRARNVGDARCQVDMTDRRHVAPLLEVRAEDVLVFQDSHPPTEFTYTDPYGAASGSYSVPYYKAGRVWMNEGPNAGEWAAREIKEHALEGDDHAVLTLQAPFPFAVTLGQEATLEQGCDRRFPICVGVFQNAINFQGEPFLPGTGTVIKIGRK